MAIPRRELVDPETPCFYHCISRCVRRAYLCGDDPFTGNSCDHRKAWIEKRMLQLAAIFSVELYAYAVMDNHYHLVLHLDPKRPQQWSDETVAEKWLQAYPSKLDKPGFEKQREMKKQAIMANHEKLKEYRARLGSLSWFMSRLNEPLAKDSNEEDNVKGRFGESRYTSIALLDETAVLSCMAYVDLNPIRAGMVKELQQSLHTSIKKRLGALQVQPELLKQSIKPMSGNTGGQSVRIKLDEYVALVEWAGKSIVHPDKAKMPAHINTLLTNLNLQPDNWLQQFQKVNQGAACAIGSVAHLKDKAKSLSKKWLKGIGSCRLLYSS